ncbi:hypothetical protein KVT40_002838 [Elsinoe batatas]|uniref:Uncharacterized protein n=1 Tax=Elsinoe batatas TaxID=2601811 RepID=A0A8K0LB19_9PEZI|nr:hypothetical protein KVT40_002838 [Elsinoe batatas]
MRSRESLSPMWAAPKHPSPWNGVFLPRGTDLSRLSKDGPEATPGLVFHRLSASERFFATWPPPSSVEPPQRGHSDVLAEPHVADSTLTARTHRYNLRPRPPRPQVVQSPPRTRVTKVTKSKRAPPSKARKARKPKAETARAKVKPEVKAKTPPKRQAKKGRKAKK